MADSPLIKKLRERARDLSTRAVDELLTSDSRSDALGAALRGVQKGRKSLDQQGARMLGALGLASVEDLERVNRKVARLRKRLLRLLDDLDDA